MKSNLSSKKARSAKCVEQIAFRSNTPSSKITMHRKIA